MNFATIEKGCLIWKKGPELVRIEAWGRDSVRIRLTSAPKIIDSPGALLTPLQTKPILKVGANQAYLQNGKIKVLLFADGHICFINTHDNQLLFEEAPACIPYKSGRTYIPLPGDLYEMGIEFLPNEGEKFYGLGQHPHGFLDQKGCSLDLFHHNTEFSIPFLVSNRLYGFLWNSPGRGKVDLTNNIRHAWFVTWKNRVCMY